MIVLLKKEIKESLRTGRLWILLAVFGFFSIMSPLSAYYLPEIIAKMSAGEGIEIKIPAPLWTDAMVQYFKNLSQICTFVIIIMFMGVVSREKENGTAVFLLLKPVSRAALIVSKMIVSIVLLTFLVSVACLITSLYTFLLFGAFPVESFIWSNLTVLLEMTVIVFMTIMFSSIAKTQILAALFSFLGWLMLGLFAQFGEAGLFSPVKLNSEAMNIIINQDINWQPYAGAGLSMIIFAFVSIFVFENYEPKK